MLGITIRYAISMLIEIIELAILIRILLSFLGELRYSKFADIIYQITEPILRPCRIILEKIGLGNGMFDFSPILAYLILRLALAFVYRIF